MRALPPSGSSCPLRLHQWASAADDDGSRLSRENATSCVANWGKTHMIPDSPIEPGPTVTVTYSALSGESDVPARLPDDASSSRHAKIKGFRRLRMAGVLAGAALLVTVMGVVQGLGPQPRTAVVVSPAGLAAALPATSSSGPTPDPSGVPVP